MLSTTVIINLYRSSDQNPQSGTRSTDHKNKFLHLLQKDIGYNFLKQNQNMSGCSICKRTRFLSRTKMFMHFCVLKPWSLFSFLAQAEAICLHPLYVMLPCTLSSSLAFMLPVATPPNAIAFSYGHLKVIDMVSKSTLFSEFLDLSFFWYWFFLKECQKTHCTQLKSSGKKNVCVN